MLSSDIVWHGAPDLEPALHPIEGRILLPGNPRDGNIPELMKNPEATIKRL